MRERTKQPPVRVSAAALDSLASSVGSHRRQIRRFMQHVDAASFASPARVGLCLPLNSSTAALELKYLHQLACMHEVVRVLAHVW